MILRNGPPRIGTYGICDVFWIWCNIAGNGLGAKISGPGAILEWDQDRVEKSRDGTVLNSSMDIVPHGSMNDRSEKLFDLFKGFGHPHNLARQIAFILEIDKLKQVWRQTPLLDCSRKENDAEHSWQLALMAVVLAEYAPEGTDMMRVVKMLLIHDIVEIDAGDNPAFSGKSDIEQQREEIKAANRLFGILPEGLEKEFFQLWEEFEAMESNEAMFARTIDRLQPFLHNYFTDGHMWLKHEIQAKQVRERSRIIGKTSPRLHGIVEQLIADAVARGYLK